MNTQQENTDRGFTSTVNMVDEAGFVEQNITEEVKDTKELTDDIQRLCIQSVSDFQEVSSSQESEEKKQEFLFANREEMERDSYAQFNVSVMYYSHDPENGSLKVLHWGIEDEEDNKSTSTVLTVSFGEEDKSHFLNAESIEHLDRQPKNTFLISQKEVIQKSVEAGIHAFKVSCKQQGFTDDASISISLLTVANDHACGYVVLMADHNYENFKKFQEETAKAGVNVGILTIDMAKVYNLFELRKSIDKTVDALHDEQNLNGFSLEIMRAVMNNYFAGLSVLTYEDVAQLAIAKINHQRTMEEQAKLEEQQDPNVVSDVQAKEETVEQPAV